MRTREKIRFDPFGWNIYSWGLVHAHAGIRSRSDELLCGEMAQHGPPLTVHRDEPITCFKCIALQAEYMAMGYAT